MYISVVLEECLSSVISAEWKPHYKREKIHSLLEVDPLQVT